MMESRIVKDPASQAHRMFMNKKNEKAQHYQDEPSSNNHSKQSMDCIIFISKT